MKIVIVNRNYFVTGGPEKYMFTLMESMPHHRFIPFCCDFRQNRETPYSKYFVAPAAGSESVYFHEFKMSVFHKFAFACNSIYHWKARRNFERLLVDERPDLALFLNAVYFSDSLIDACRAHDVPIIWRLSDFNKVCANYQLYRDGKVCEECLEHGLTRAIRNRCGGYQRSMAASIVKTTGMWLSRVRGLHDHIDFFITSAFTREKMIKGGFNALKVVQIPTMVKMPEDPPQPLPSPPEILFVGRLSHEKGVATLLKAFELGFKSTNVRLSIVGNDTSPNARELKSSVPDTLRNRVTFHGFQERTDPFFKRAYCIVAPSVWYENQPNAVLEGMSHARPAVVSDLGSMKEMVVDGETGYRFEAGNASDLAAKLGDLLSNPQKAQEMGLRAMEYVLNHHSFQKHLCSLEALFQRCLDQRKSDAPGGSR